ncbi:MFS transporter [Streptacidiphilus fuscans]|uniref:MFS transporter n=1 Tax=Streptacidiphilus fuscans TaxID=2789292 RepID=UPI002E2C1501|nr:MFS transporter [Streptacidiphilus fuscans]
MVGSRRLGRAFGWLWAAYSVSALGTWLAFDAFSIIAIRVLHSGPTAVSFLAAAGLAVGAVVAVPLGPWMEFRRKRPVMVSMDLIRFAVLLTVPLAYALGALTFAQLLVVSVITSAADITFNAASGATIKSLVPKEDLLVASARFESTSWTATVLGPPLGGAAIGLLGPLTTVIANAVSFVCSALGIRAIGGVEPAPEPAPAAHPAGSSGLLEGWRFILRHPTLRLLQVNCALNNGLIMASVPLLAVLMMGQLHFAPWQYGLAFAAPSLGGLLGSRIARPLAARYGRHRVLYVSGVARAVWPIGLAFIGPGTPGLVWVMVVELGLITCSGVFNPLLSTTRLELAPPDRVARTLSAWSVSNKISIAALTALWGLLAGLVGTRTAIGVAGALLLATPVLLPRREHAQQPEPELTASAA